MTRAARIVIAALAGCLALVPLRAAHAQTEACDRQYHDGVEQRRQGRDAEALENFRQAWEGCRRPRARVQMAWASQALGRWVDAAATLREALATRDDPWVEARRAQLEGDLRTVEGHVGSLTVTCDAPGAEVRLDGAVVATLPMSAPLPWPAGDVQLEVRLAGRHTVTRSVAIAPGRVTEERVDLGEESPGAPVVVPPVTLPPVVVQAPRRSALRHGLGVGAWVGAGVMLVGAAVTYGYGLSLVNDYNGVNPQTGEPACPGIEATFQPGDCGEWLRTSRAMQTTAQVGLSVGVALAVTAVVLLVAERRGAEPTNGTAFTCGSGPGSLGVACGVHF